MGQALAPIRLHARLLTYLSEVSNMTAPLLLVEIVSERRVNKSTIACPNDSRLCCQQETPQMNNASE